MKKIFVLIFILLSIKNFCQEKYEYFGALQLNGNNKTIITYRLVFSELDGVIKGYSVTDLGGEYETKNSVSGTYNSKTKNLVFNEDDILYTKSKLKTFCYVNYSGKVKLVDNGTKIEGDFQGQYKNKTKCINGTVALIGSNKIYKFLSKANKRIQNSKKVDEVTKAKVNPIRILDSLKVNNLLRNQNLTLYVKSDQVDIEIWDDLIEDGDVIDLYQNDVLILNHYEILNKKKKITIKIDKPETVFKVQAISEGYKPPNTAQVQIIDGERVFELKTNLKKDENATLTIVKSVD
jgi:hypothetical protein